MSKEELELFKELLHHMEYCGWGDKWERECADYSKLPERCDALVAKYEKT